MCVLVRVVSSVTVVGFVSQLVTDWQKEQQQQQQQQQQRQRRRQLQEGCVVEICVSSSVNKMLCSCQPPVFWDHCGAFMIDDPNALLYTK